MPDEPSCSQKSIVSASPRLWEGLRGWCSWLGANIPWGFCLRQLLCRSELAWRGQSCDSPCLPQDGVLEDDGAWGSENVLLDGGRESFVFMTGLSLELRGSGVVSTMAAAGIPSVTVPKLSILRRASWDERGWSRHDEVEAGSGCDGPVGGAAVLCTEPDSLVPIVVEGSVDNRKYRSRGEHPGRARRVGLLSPHLKAIT